ncbi:calcium-binding protein [Streptomyces sp. NPDC001292]|uniref:calcium-binding protein n=1 Tax=Streptomyces sp. NPDC001292 TaxID=3364558 RepID=UPI0036773998
MRIRATVAAVSGALVLSALAVPVAQADGPRDVKPNKPSAAERFGTSSAKSAFRALAAEELPTVSKVTVNSGKAVVVGTTYAKTFTVSLTASHATGIQDAYVDLWHGTDAETDVDGYLPPNEDVAKCTAASATTSTCKLTITAYPGTDLYKNALAGTWKVTAGALAGDGSVYWNDYQTTHRVQRNPVLTINATPEPVKKGYTITVVGKLTRANWETGKYHGYTYQYVKLQFLKKGSTAYTTLKTIKTDSKGNLKTTTRATADGYFRYSFAGTSTTPAINSRADFVDVK